MDSELQSVSQTTKIMHSYLTCTHLLFRTEPYLNSDFIYLFVCLFRLESIPLACSMNSVFMACLSNYTV